MHTATTNYLASKPHGSAWCPTRPPTTRAGTGSDCGPERSRLDQMIGQCYPDLLRVAARLFLRESAGHLLEPAALVSELYLRLVSQRTQWRNREHFFALATRLMGRILIDHARRGCAIKRVPMPDVNTPAVVPPTNLDALALERALAGLAVRAQRQHAVTRLRFHAGLTVAETARALGVSPATVKLDWQRARAWLCKKVGRD